MRQIVDALDNTYQLAITYDGKRCRGKLTVGYDLNPATGIATIGIQVQGEHAVVGPTNASLVVASDYRGRGVGTALLNAAVSVAKEKGARKVTSTIHPTNSAAIRTSQKNGFIAIGTTEDGMVKILGEIR